MVPHSLSLFFFPGVRGAEEEKIKVETVLLKLGSAGAAAHMQREPRKTREY